MVANAFSLPPMLLGLENDVNRASSSEFGDEAFRGAIVPVARLLAEHITRDVFGKRLGWREFEFRLQRSSKSRDETTELQIQTELLKAGVLTVSEVRALRGLGRPSQPDRKKQEDETRMNQEIGENGMKLEAMAVTMPQVRDHPNRVPFEGVLTLVDVPSDRAPSGARGHRVILTRGAADAALPSLLGMAVDFAPAGMAMMRGGNAESSRTRRS